MVSYQNIKKFALISVYDKSNLKVLCKAFEKFNIGIISTGSTFSKIKNLGFKCFEISKILKSKEILDGRVKTLHPKIYSSILFDRENKEHNKTFNNINFPKIDFVIVNLYPFKKFIDKKVNEKKLIEMIDIGGPSLIRASSKNFNSLTTVCSPSYYRDLCDNLINNNGVTDLNFRKKMAKEAFLMTSNYDKKIYQWMSLQTDKKTIKLRYGENPNQKAKLSKTDRKNFFDYQIQGKKISYNNILDINSGLDFLAEFIEPTVVIIKHGNACGVASSKNINYAFTKAFNADKQSSFGGIVLLNKNITPYISNLVVKNFFEAVIATGFDKKSIEILKNKKNLILINSKKIKKNLLENTRSVRGGNLIQKIDIKKITKKNFSLVSKDKKINRKEYEDILFAFKIVKHIKSNAIVLVKNKQTIGIGAGQMNRFDATRIALMKFKENFNIKGFTCASDAFFPFTDSLDLLSKNNCSCVVQPSGSIRDKQNIKFANKKNIKLVFSKIRVFKH